MPHGSPGERFFLPMAFDFLWEAVGLGDLAYPLDVPSHGATMNERVSLRHRVDAQLRAQGVKDRFGRVDPEVERWLTLLARGPMTIDALWVPGAAATAVTSPARALAAIGATDGSVGVLAVQDADADGIWLRSIDPDTIASEVIGLLPTCQRGIERSITISREVAASTTPVQQPVRTRNTVAEPDTLAERMGLGSRKQQRSRVPLSERTAGDQRQDYARLAGQRRLGGGQFTVNTRDSFGRRRRSGVLAWFDSETGRYLSLTRTGSDGHEWVTVSPGDVPTLRSRLTDMAGELGHIG